MAESLDWTDPLPVRRVERDPDAEYDARRWPYGLGAVRQLLSAGIELGSANVLVGPNGAGKSTLVEAIAMAYGLSPEGGSTGARHSTYVSESPLHETLRIIRGPGAQRWGYFIRAETMHGLFTYLKENPGKKFEPYHDVSHGESFLELLYDTRFDSDGFFVFDEPEAGLAFEAQLKLMARLVEIVSRPGSQVLLATHSPVLVALPGARLLQVGPDGIEQTRWEDLEVVRDYRRFCADPQRYLRFLT